MNYFLLKLSVQQQHKKKLLVYLIHFQAFRHGNKNIINIKVSILNNIKYNPHCDIL